MRSTTYVTNERTNSRSGPSCASAKAAATRCWAASSSPERACQPVHLVSDVGLRSARVPDGLIEPVQCRLRGSELLRRVAKSALQLRVAARNRAVAA